MVKNTTPSQEKAHCSLFLPPGFLRILLAGLAIACAGTLTTPAQQVLWRFYTTADGLAHNHVMDQFQDRKGFIWFGTEEGVSRFDGYRFTNYDQRHGLPHPYVIHVVEDCEGHIWVGANGGGVARLLDDPQERMLLERSPPNGSSGRSVGSHFISYRMGPSTGSNKVEHMAVDFDNKLWVTTEDGLYCGLPTHDSDRSFIRVTFEGMRQYPGLALVDSKGRLWFIAEENELIQLIGERPVKYALPCSPHCSEGKIINSGSSLSNLAEDRHGQLLIATRNELWAFVPPPTASETAQWRKLLTYKHWISYILSDSSGALWIVAGGALLWRAPDQQEGYSVIRQSDDVWRHILEARDRSLWVTSAHGVGKLMSRSIVNYTATADGSGFGGIRLFQTQTGQIYFSCRSNGILEIKDGSCISPPGAHQLPYSKLEWSVLYTRRGDWWFATHQGIYRIVGSAFDLHHAEQVLSFTDDYPTGGRGRLYEDPQGRMWFGDSYHNFYSYDPLDGQVMKQVAILSQIDSFALEMWLDRAGRLWIATFKGLFRFFDGKLEMISPRDGLPSAPGESIVQARYFFSDSRGWLWIAHRYSGVSVTYDPAAPDPHFINYSVADGLSCNAVWAITEDQAGRIYFGTNCGLNIFDPATRRIRQVRTTDGLADENIGSLLTDRQGYIWIGASKAVSRYDPHEDSSAPDPAPPVYITRVQISGDESIPVAETGVRSIPLLLLDAASNSLQIEYVAVSLTSEKALRYQYRLEGTGNAEWSPPNESRAISLARLAHGDYRLQVRAVNRDGISGAEPASFSFRILPPIWRQWWFLGLVATLLTVTAYIIHRLWLARLLGIERMRTRIATDLHDDIGANLTRIAMLSEVLKTSTETAASAVNNRLSQIAAISSESVDAMSDIVWAIDPQHDQLIDLISRLRRIAGDTFQARHIEFQYTGPEDEINVPLGPDERRDIFLIAKEGINNIVRHSGCRKVLMSVKVEQNMLELTLCDDGRGFDPACAVKDGRGSYGGNGLVSMKHRAHSLGGQLQIETEPDTGTTLVLRIPLSNRRRWRAQTSMK